MGTLLVIVLVVGALVGGFVFAKNNPNKAKVINDTVKAEASKVADAAKAEAVKLQKK